MTAGISSKDKNDLKALKEEIERLKERIKKEESPGGRDPSHVKSADLVKTETREVNGYLITCKTCGIETVKQRKNAKYCSDKCRIEGYNTRTGNGKGRLKFNDYN